MCTDGEDPSTSSDARFSKYGQKLSIRAPKGAIEAPKAGGGPGGGSGTPV